MKVVRTLTRVLLGGAVALAMGSAAHAVDVSYTGTVGVIEVWQIGNVAFKLNGVSSTCASSNGDWMVINKSMDGAKNFYAALLAAKLAEKPIRIWSSGCGSAEGFGPSPYVIVGYLYLD